MSIPFHKQLYLDKQAGQIVYQDQFIKTLSDYIKQVQKEEGSLQTPLSRYEDDYSIYDDDESDPTK